MEQLSCAMNLYLQSVKPAPKRISCSSEIKFARSILLRFALASCLLLHCVRFVKYRQKFMIEKCQVRKRITRKMSSKSHVKQSFSKHWKIHPEQQKGQIEKEEPISFYNFSIICVQFIYSRRTCFLVHIFWRMHYCAFASEKYSLLYSFIARFEKFLDDIWQE